MKNENVFLALRTIALRTEDTAPVKLTVGYCDEGFVRHNEVVLLDCPPATITALQREGFVISMSETAGGLLLEDFEMKPKHREVEA